MNNLDRDDGAGEPLNTDGDVVFANAYVDVMAGFVFGELDPEETLPRVDPPNQNQNQNQIVLLKLE